MLVIERFTFCRFRCWYLGFNYREKKIKQNTELTVTNNQCLMKKVNWGNLEDAGWDRVDTHYFVKPGFAIWYWDYWTLDTPPGSGDECPSVIKKNVQSMDELQELTTR